MNLGFTELLVILVIVLVLFGGNKLAGLGAGLGKAIRGFREGMRDEPPPPGPKPGAKRELPPDDGDRK